MSSPAQPPGGRRPPLSARLIGAGARAGERVASATGLDSAVETATEEAIVRALESPAVERAIVRVLESEAAQESLERMLTSPAVERAASRALDSEVVNRAWEQLLASDEVQSLIERIAEAPEIRTAIASQGRGLISDMGRQIRRIADRFDGGSRACRPAPDRQAPHGAGRFGRPGHPWCRVRDRRDDPQCRLLPRRGSDQRAVRQRRPLDRRLSVRSRGLGRSSAPLPFTFWSLAGQTPGMRFLSIRIEHEGSYVLGPRVARRRLVGLILALIPAGLGLLGIVTRDNQRGFQDRRADTDVVRVDPATRWSPPTE